MPTNRLHLSLVSSLASLDPLADAIEAFCLEWGAPAEASAFTLCAEELFTNVVVHGFGGAAGHAIDVVLRHDPDGLAVEIVDDAPAFDPTAPVAPDLAATLEERTVGGLGRHLVSTLMERFCYRRAQGRNHVVFGRAAGGQGER